MKKEQVLELLVNMGISLNEGFVYSPKTLGFLAQQIDQLYQPDKLSAEEFVENCSDLAEFVKGKIVDKRFKGNVIPVVEFNELRERAQQYDATVTQPTTKLSAEEWLKVHYPWDGVSPQGISFTELTAMLEQYAKYLNQQP